MSLGDSGVSFCEGFVLAGGFSKRMGRDKSLVNFHGALLIQHAVTILCGAGLETRIAGAHSDLSSFAKTISDDPACSDLGPLSGICAGLEACSTRCAVFLPVDLPLLPVSLVQYLVRHATTSGAAITVASVNGFVETFPVVIDAAANSELSARLRSSDRKCLAAFHAAAAALSRPLSVIPVELLLQAGQVADPYGFRPQTWFSSLNTPEDLSRAERLVESHLRLS